jgi:two-component system, OmpR family, sensor histidine kinase BaeS
MLRSLRGRLIASHVGLIFIVIPLLGLALTFVLESQVVLQNLARQLTGQAVLVGQLLERQAALPGDPPWATPQAAQAFVDRIGPLFPGQLQLLSGQGLILASSDPSDLSRVGQRTRARGIDVALGGENFSRVLYSRDRQAEIADVLVPFRASDGTVVAIVRITDNLSTAQERFARLRVLIASVLAGGMLAGAILGLILAVTIERPLGHLTRAVETFGHTSSPQDVSTGSGPEDVRALARAFRDMARRIHDLEENRRYLLANIVHELGRPLGAMRAADRALMDGAGDDPELRDDLLKGIDGEIGRMEALLDELSGLRDMAAGRAPLRREPVTLSEWLPQLLAPWREAAGSAGLAWAADIPSDLPAVEIDPRRLGQAFGNLLSNAVKYTPPPGEVLVSAWADERHWHFRVLDTGPGVRPEEQERIFEPFYRTPPERRYPQGLGLGLAIARDLVRAHGGHVFLDSCDGSGACFTVTLPLSGPEPDDEAKRVAAATL